MVMDVRSLMRRSALYHQHRPAVIENDTRLTFGEAWTRGLRMANGLLDLGLEPGDRVGVLEDNTFESVDFFCGTAAANLVRVPLYPRNSREAHVHMLAHTGCRAVVVSQSHAEALAGIVDEVPSLEHILVRDDGYEPWLAAQSDVDPDPEVDPDDWFIIRHTGGTTGLPKGVGYTHRSWLAAGRDWFYNLAPVEFTDVCQHAGPISHGSGYLFTPVWLSGGVNLLVPKFDPAEVIATMARERVTFGFLVPAMLNAIVRHPTVRDHDWSHLKVLQVGASPIADDTALLAHEILGDCLYQGYGQTEAVPITMMGPREWFGQVEGSNPLRSAGRPLPFGDIEIVDPETSQPLPLGEEGEIAIRCDGQMTGFWENPEATAERMRDGWVLTGDIGRIDQNGYLYVLDRKDDMIISGGFNIWPAELENVLTDHPDVLEAGVFGVPSERWGESPYAVVMVAEGATVTSDELIELCADRLGSYKKPANVELTTEELPKSPVGKLARKVLREPHWEGRDRRVAGN
ncbi:MAG: acyl-CoA synthetase (AMP-forming)/AMP-acid ligase II [Acidimicrobiales bacterium]|jgi:acyl-CoA synthetase (AMP-forming)/AMP-acid ligase II